ncbi:MAG: ECF transporter S component [Candidatus Merdivicinus sp.]|jgi:uncharacterized membrane protein
MQGSKQNRQLIFLVSVGMMAALVFVGNYLQFKIPVAIGSVTRVHLGNSMCLLAGLLFGPMTGGLASGIGAGLFDLLDPMYITSAPYTFFSKFVMGFLAGWIARGALTMDGKNRLFRLIIGGVTGQIAYMILYLGKSFVELVLVGNPVQTALVAVLPKVATSGFNALAAVVISVPLSIALYQALKRTGFSTLMTGEKKQKSNPYAAG